MEYEDVVTWEDYKEYVRTHNPEAYKILEQAHEEAKAISFLINGLKDSGETIAIQEIAAKHEASDILSRVKRKNSAKSSKFKRVRARSVA